MKHKKCSVKGCTAECKRTFRFPNPATDKKRFLKWFAACGNIELVNVVEEKITSRMICIHHFEEYYILSKRLSTTAVPTLNLPDPIDEFLYKFKPPSDSINLDDCEFKEELKDIEVENEEEGQHVEEDQREDTILRKSIRMEWNQDEKALREQIKEISQEEEINTISRSSKQNRDFTISDDTNLTKRKKGCTVRTYLRGRTYLRRTKIKETLFSKHV